MAKVVDAFKESKVMTSAREVLDADDDTHLVCPWERLKNDLKK